MTPNCTILSLREELGRLTSVPPSLQKLVGLRPQKGITLDDETCLVQLKLKKGRLPFMMIGNATVYQDPDEADIPEVLDDLDVDYVYTIEQLCEVRANPEHQKKFDKYLAKLDINLINSPREGKKLLVLDLDYTLFDMKSKADNFEQLKRPLTDEFLTAMYQDFDLVIWSQTSWKWLVSEMKLARTARIVCWSPEGRPIAGCISCVD